MKADRSAKKMRLFGACEDNERLIIKLIFNVQCTLNELVCVFFLLLSFIANIRDIKDAFEVGEMQKLCSSYCVVLNALSANLSSP